MSIAAGTLSGHQNNGVVGAAGGFFGGIVSMAVGSAVSGAVAGSWAGPWGIVAGAVAGFVVGGIAGAAAEWGVNAVGAGLSGDDGGGPGGVDMRHVPQIDGFSDDPSLLLPTKDIRLGIPLSSPDSWEAAVRLVNNRLQPATPLTSTDIADLLVHEAFYFTQVLEIPVLFSLHFGTEASSNLYTVMHPNCVAHSRGG